MSYIICSTRDVFWRYFDRSEPEWCTIKKAKHLTAKYLEVRKPELVFFPHWSSIVPPEITDNYECVLFHTFGPQGAPQGRGGSPIQNLILDGHESGMLTALRMTQELDAGPVYMARPVSLLGSLDEIFDRVYREIVLMIDELARVWEKLGVPICAAPQEGEPTVYKRRKPEDGNIYSNYNPSEIHNLIRSFDGEGYPKAHFELIGTRFEFSNAVLRPDCIEAHVKITEVDE